MRCVGIKFRSVAPDCLAILKIVHELTERLIRETLQTGQQEILHSPETLTQLVSVARRIGPRVDDVVNALYPPLDPRLLEARSVRRCRLDRKSDLGFVI